MDFRFTREEEELKQRIRKVAEERIAPIAEEVDEMHVVSWDVVRILAQEGLFRLMYPKEYGGVGVKVVNLCIGREELARVSHHADGLFIQQGLGSYPIVIAGTEAQKQKYLPPLARGEKLGTLAVTEHEAGSDVGSIATTAIREGNHYVLNGEKRFISHAGDAHTYVVLAKTDPSQRTRGISAFIVEKGMPGFDDSRRMTLMSPHAIGEPRFVNCRVPQENLLGELGQGFRIAMRNLDIFRTTVGASAVGMAQAALEEAVKRAKSRVQFGQPIANFQVIQFKLADMATEVEAARLLVYRAASLKDQGQENVTREASMAKLFATEMASRVADESLQIHGGSGMVKGIPIERIYRAVRAPRVYEGTSEVQRIVISRAVLKD